MIHPAIPVIGASFFAEYDGSFLDFARAAVDAGFRLVELKMEPFPRRTSGPEEEALRRLAQTTGLVYTVHAPYLTVNIGGLDEARFIEAREAYTDALRFASRIGARAVTLHAGKIPREAWTPEAWEICRRRSIQGIADALDAAGPSAVAAAVENLGPFRPEVVKYGVTVAELLEIRRALGGRAGFTLDVGHLRPLEVSPVEAVRALGPSYIHQVHLHTNTGTWDDHAALSAEEVWLQDLLAACRKEGWSFPLTIEVRNWQDLLASRVALIRCWETAAPTGEKGL